MILHSTQKVVALDKHRFRVVNCGRRWGKTTLAILEMVAKGVFKKDSRIVYIAPTYQQARDIAWQELKKITAPIQLSVNEARLEITINTKEGDGTSIIWLRGWESVETLRGQRFDFVVIDEIASMRNFWLNWQEVIRPTLTDRKGEVLFISTPKGFNHFYDLFNTNDEDYKSFHFTTYDNPHLPVEEIDKARKELPEDRFYQEYMADFRKQEGLVYKEFSRDRHVIETLPTNFVESIAGIDFGFTNPTAVIHIKKDRDENYYVTEEWYKTQRTEEQIGEYVKSCNFNKVYPDPESPSAINIMNTKGINVVEVIKNKDSIQTGISRVRTLLKTGKLKIHKSCTNLINEFETYAYPETKNGSNEQENPIKSHDHALDALRYALSTNSSDGFLTAEQRARNFFEAKRNLASNSR